MNANVNWDGSQHLNFLLEFLVAWEERPLGLTPIAYGWCSTIHFVDGSISPLRFQLQDVTGSHITSVFAEQGFSSIGPLCDPVRTGDTSHPNHRYLQSRVGFSPRTLLFMILEVGFRLVMPGRNQPTLHLDHTPNHSFALKSAFSSDDDEVIADGLCAWIANSDYMPAGSCVHYLAKRVENDTPFSPRLRRMGVRLIERMWCSRFGASELETVRLLNRLDISVDDVENTDEWADLLVDAISSPVGLESLSIRCWNFLEALSPVWGFPIARAMELARLLEEVEDWEKLEAWMAIAWQADWDELGKPTWLEGLEYLKQVTLKHLLRRPSALPRFEGLLESKKRPPPLCVALRHICAQARAERLPLEPPPP